MAKAVQAYTETGWKFVPNCPFQVNYNGEANYTPFVQKLQSCGAQIVYNDSTPGPTLYGALEAENQIGYDPIWVEDSGAYTAAFAQWNTAGLGNNVYVRIAYEPLEAAKVVPAVAQYLAIVKKYGGLTSQLGEQSTSSFLLWATEAKACGSTLTRQCMINKLSTVTSLDRRRAQRVGQPGQEPAAQLRAPDEARQHQVGAGVPEEARAPSTARRSTSWRTRARSSAPRSTPSATPPSTRRPRSSSRRGDRPARPLDRRHDLSGRQLRPCTCSSSTRSSAWSPARSTASPPRDSS